MHLRTEIKTFWRQLLLKHKLILSAAGLIVMIFLVSGWFLEISTFLELRSEKGKRKQFEKEAQEHQAAANKFRDLGKAAVNALKKKEEKFNEKQGELNTAKVNTRNARDNYNDVRSNPRDRIPTAAELCEEFKALGYPCSKPNTDTGSK